MRILPIHLDSEMLTAKKIAKGIEMTGCDAMNVGQFEIAAGYDFLKSIMDTIDLPFVSANIKNTIDGKYAFDRYKIIEKDGIKVGITGVISTLPEKVTELTLEPYLDAGQEIIAELESKAHVIVMMVNATRKNFEEAKNAFHNADYIFTSGSLHTTRVEQEQDVNGPKEYSSGKQGKFLTQIELTIANIDSPIVDVSSAAEKIKSVDKRLKNLQKRDPNKSLREIFANNKTMLSLIGDYEAKRIDAQKTLEHVVNSSEYSSVPMNSKVKDQPEILSYVNQALAEIKKVKNSERKPVNTTNKKRAAH